MELAELDTGRSTPFHHRSSTKRQASEVSSAPC